MKDLVKGKKYVCHHAYSECVYEYDGIGLFDPEDSEIDGRTYAEGHKVLREATQEPETFMPVVGEEFGYSLGENNAWNEGVLRFIDKIAVIEGRSGIQRSYDTKIVKFRPIKTEREKTIEWAVAEFTIVNEDAIKALKVELGSLYDLGALKIPESEQ